MTQQYKWLSTVAQMKVLAAELIRAAEIMGGDDEESQDVELILAVSPAGTVLDDDHAVNDTPVLTVSLAEYPEEGVYPVDPHNPTGGRIDAPCLTCSGHGMVGGLTLHSGYDAQPCPECTPTASAQDDAKDWRDQVMEIITGVWDREIQIDHAADEIMGLLSPTSSAPGDAQDEQVRHKMNADLCAFYMSWEADGDYLRCRKCKRPQIASYAEKGFPHAAGCKAEGNVEQRPWLALIELMRPLIGSAAPAAGDALPNFDIEAAAQKMAECMDYPWAHMPEQGRTHMRKYAQAVIDAALAAQVPKQGEA